MFCFSMTVIIPTRRCNYETSRAVHLRYEYMIRQTRIIIKNKIRILMGRIHKLTFKNKTLKYCPQLIKIVLKKKIGKEPNLNKEVSRFKLELI